jgi:DNA polymerase
MFIGPLTVVDYSAIEARVIAWLADEEWVLEAFRAGRDIYVENAKLMGGLKRSQGKIAVLALNYNGAAGSLRGMAAPDDPFIQGKSDDQLNEEYVYPYRQANKRIVRLWKILDSRFRTGGAVGPILKFEKDGKDRLLRLPSGRAICYRKCGIHRDAKGHERLHFQSPIGYRADTYGGRLAENATQAVARDLMAEALVRLEERGFPVVGHVHDEIIIQGEHDVDEIRKIMNEPPSWSTGLPIDSGGYNCLRYRKG